MSLVEELASFAATRSYSDLSQDAQIALKARVLDSLGCAIAALRAPPLEAVRAQIEDFGGSPRCSLIGGGHTAPDRAALYNGALARYLDYNDGYLAPGETCHPSDNLGAVLAACDYVGASGGDLLTALAVAYQVQCRLADVAPVRGKGFDHTVHLSYSAAAGVCRALGLDPQRSAHAIAIAGAAHNGLRVTRTGALSQWKGLAAPWTASMALEAAFLAMRGVTGPLGIFEGHKGFMDLAGRFELDWSNEDLERVTRTAIKAHDADLLAQPALEAMIELRTFHGVTAAEVERIEIQTFQLAFDTIGGGAEGPRHQVFTKEQADHSLPYLLAVALIDGVVTPEQFFPTRLQSTEVQELMDRIVVKPDPDLTRRFPAELPVRLELVRRSGFPLRIEKHDYLGYYSRPLPWDGVVRKFERLAATHASPELRLALINAVAGLETIPAPQLTGLLRQVGQEEEWPIRERGRVESEAFHAFE